MTVSTSPRRTMQDATHFNPGVQPACHRHWRALHLRRLWNVIRQTSRVQTILSLSRGPALIVEPAGVTNAHAYQLYVIGLHVAAWSQPDVAWSRRSHVNTIVYICVLQFVDMGSSAFRGRRSSELRPTHVTCKSEPSHVVGTDGYS